MLLPSPSSMRAAATTPAEPADARVARFPAAGSLPRQKGGSASALLVSGPARRSLALQPAWSLSRPRRPRCIASLASRQHGSLTSVRRAGRLPHCYVSGPARAFTQLQPAWSLSRPGGGARYIGVLQAMSLPPSPAPIATGWSDSCRAGFAPARRRRLSTAHVESGAGAVTVGYGGCSVAFAPGLSPSPLVPFPDPRSSNRTCGLPASGFRTRSCLRARKGHGLPRETQEAVICAQPLLGESHESPRSRLVLSTVPLA